MQFTLTTAIPEFPFQLSHKDKVLLAGSCFSENISDWMLRSGFTVESNPWGILFNPISLAKMLENIVHPDQDTSFLPVERDGGWVSLHQHSSLHANASSTLLEKIHKTRAATHRFLKEAKTIIITFGTANVFVHQSSGEMVANCHKLPADQFNRKRLTVEDVVNTWIPVIESLPEHRFIFTVSPVRHSKDGLIENNLSKATLLLATQQLIQAKPQQCFYFPSYEIVLDELRDYRFFKEDMIHPNETAIRYVWEKWQCAMYSSATNQMNKQYLSMVKRLQHRNLMSDSGSSSSDKELKVEWIKSFISQHKELNGSYLYALLENDENEK